MQILLGKWSQKEIDSIIQQASKIKDTGSKIAFLSGYFLNVVYKEKTLIGDINTPEVFVINLEGVDCFTFIDYIEAMRLSDSFSEFIDNLKIVRYRSGKIAFENRNHFFTDWQEYNSDFVENVTEHIAGQKTEKIVKILNKKEDGSYFLSGIQPIRREIRYIPSRFIDSSVLNRLQTGDYAGIYSNKQGLDVSHAGIIIKRGSSIYLRHASSEKEHRKVTDHDFRGYISDKPGLIVLRFL